MTKEKRRFIRILLDRIANVGLVQLLFIPIILSSADEFSFALSLGIILSFAYAYASGVWLGAIER